MTKKPPFDLSLVPGTPKEQREIASRMRVRREKPIAIRKVGSKYEVVVLGTPIGAVAKKGDACSAAFQVGKYRLELGDFAYSYVDGWNGCDR